MPYADPERQAAHQREVQRDRSRGVAIYRAALLWCAADRSEKGRQLFERLTQMLTAELLWRKARGIPLPRWPEQREDELIRLSHHERKPTPRGVDNPIS